MNYFVLILERLYAVGEENQNRSQWETLNKAEFTELIMTR